MKLVVDAVQVRVDAFELALSATIAATIAAICGPSGAGKTTLLELLAGLRRPSAGRISLDGEALDAPGLHLPPELRRLGYVPQEGALFPHLDVRGNLFYGLARAVSRRPDIEPAPRALDRAQVVGVLELGELLDRPVEALSGGERRRVALGRALLSGPRLLLLDEPLVNLHDALRERIRDYLLRIRDELGVPILFVTHDARDVDRLAEVVLRLEGGRLVGQGAPESLLEPDPSARRFRA